MSLSYSELQRLANAGPYAAFAQALGGVGVLLGNKKHLLDDEDGWSFNTETGLTDISLNSGGVDFILHNDDVFFPIKKAPGATAFATTILIGRAASNDICLADPGISKLHARIFLRPSGPTLADNASHNGTMMKQHRLLPHQESPLQHGDWLFFAEQSLQFLQLEPLHAALRGS